MNTTLDIEQFDSLLQYLRQAGQFAPDENPRFTKLQGGVSNRTVLVESANGRAFVVKQALERLRVASEWHSDPRRIEREALGLTWLERLAPPGTITPLLFLDRQQHLLAMAAVPQPHENWKTLLLEERLELEYVEQFAQLLALVHSRSREHGEIPGLFDDRTFFETLRIEPYYQYTATQVPLAARFLHELITDTLARREALVHGDYSPKNVLIHRGKLVLLDHEVIHFGDPAFDLGFALTHFLSKAHHLPGARLVFLEAAKLFWRIYQEQAAELARTDGFESRVGRHTLACLLARVDGRSPLEYLGTQERICQRRACLQLMNRAEAGGVAELVDQFAAALD